MSHKLGTLARLRRLQTLEARRDMAAAAAAEIRAEALLTGAEAALLREAAVEADPGAFAAWLPRGNAAKERGHVGTKIAGETVQRARMQYAAKRRAEEAVHRLIEEQEVAARKDEARKAEQRMGDLAQRGAPGRSKDSED